MEIGEPQGQLTKDKHFWMEVKISDHLDWT